MVKQGTPGDGWMGSIPERKGTSRRFIFDRFFKISAGFLTYKNAVCFKYVRRDSLVNVVNIIRDAVAFIPDLYRQLYLKTQLFFVKFKSSGKFLE